MPLDAGSSLRRPGYNRPKLTQQKYNPAKRKYRGPTTRSARSANSYGPRYYKQRLSGGGSGGYGGGSGFGSGGGGGGSFRVSKPKPPPSLSSWLRRDVDYQDQLRAFGRSLSDFGADIKRRTGKVEADFTSGSKSMGEQRVRDLQDIMNDFAARGLLKSGLYGQRQADYEKQYQTNLSELGRNRTSLLGDISQEQKQFSREQSLQKESARKEAARRRAEKYGL
jgi:hypothetical protein